MSNLFNLFLNQAQLNKYPLSTANLNYVLVNKKDKTLKFDVTFDEIMSAAQLSLFIDQLQTYFKKPDVVSKVDYKIHFKSVVLKDLYQSFYEMIIHKASELYAPLSVFKNYGCEYIENTYFIIVDKNATNLNKYLKTLKDVFIQHGLHIDLKLKINEVLVTVEEQVTKHIENEKEFTRQQQNKVEVILDTKKSFTVKSSPQAVKISEIPVTQYELDKYKYEKGDTNFLVEGEIFKLEFRQLKNTNLLTFSIFDNNDAITVKRFVKAEKDIELAKSLRVGDIVQVSGEATYDTFIKEVSLMTRAIHQIERPKKIDRQDKATEKRIEFHIHSKASPMDAVTAIGDYVETLENWGHEAMALTDKNGVYAFPDFNKALKGKNIKPIFGVELDFINEDNFHVATPINKDFNLKEASYVVFDIETTGLSNTRDKIIEIAAYKITGGIIGERFEYLINPEEKLLEITKNLTNISDEMLEGKETIEQVLPKFLEFIKGSCLVAHNASFDVGFLYEKSRQLGLDCDTYPVIDTLNLLRYFYNHENKEKNHARFYMNDAGNIPDLKRFNLKTMSKFFKVNLESHHRAIYDAYATAEVFLQMLQNMYKEGIYTYCSIEESLDRNTVWKYPIPKYATVLAKNQDGYKNLFKIVSDSLTDHFHNGPKLTKETINKYKEGILIGSGTSFGEVFEAALNSNDEVLEKAISFYDYIEVHPLPNYKHLFSNLGPLAKEILQSVIVKIINKSKELNKIVIASSNAYYLEPEDKKYRDIYIDTKSVGGGLHPLAGYDTTPEQHLLTTNEMLDQFSFLDSKTAYEIVVTNTRKLNDLISKVQAFPKDLYSIPDDAFKDTLGIESIAEKMKKMVFEKAHELYGKDLNTVVSLRIDKELKSIIDNQFAPIYFISHLLVKKSLDDGYLVGSRGSVGSSFIATLLEITEVNPLRPHYRCANGDFSIFKLTDEEIYDHGYNKEHEEYIEALRHVKSGYDLPNKTCPCCGRDLVKDGHDIPFETFLGFDGDKVPDIDLNFSGDYQSKAHEYVRELLGEEYCFRAGTIQTVAERNAYGYVKGYLEDKNINARGAYIELLAKGIEGARRSTGQHPGGIVVVPKHKTIYDVTPIQYPADDITSNWKTTHFDYHSFENNLLKLDILGHDDPTMIKFFMDYVKQNPNEFPFTRAQDIPLDDKQVYKLFESTKVLGFENEDVYGPIASYAIPEFGTPFTRQMLKDTKPTTFAGLVKISGLSHGTDVWLKNSQDLVLGKTDYGQISFDDVIGCRDDIMVELADRGMQPFKAFEIMEFVRKGKPSTNPVKWKDYEDEMRANKIPEWYIWSAKQIKYMFPKAHATAYVIMAMRIAWFKVHKPLLFYSGFFSKRAVQFDHDTMVSGYNAIRNKLITLLNSTDLKNKDEDVMVTLYVALEMTKRGFKFLPVDINKSDALEFVMENDGLRMPFVSIDGLGTQVALNIVEARKIKAFDSKEDIQKRSKINKTVFEKLENIGTFKDFIDKSDEIGVGLFDI